jgi:hypothetical protein
MTIIQESFQRLFPNKEFNYKTKLEYNRRLGSFNANIRKTTSSVQVNLNLQWKDIDKEIKVGLIQTLLLKVFKSKNTTTNIELYNNFVKNIPQLTPKTNIEPVLKESFDRVNKNFFYEQLEMPNLVWGNNSKRKLASYNFHNDTVSVSTIFKKTEIEILDYLMYHELLHKYHQYNHKNGRSFFHTREFKKDENLYPNKKLVENKINQIIRNTTIRNKKSSWKDIFR